MTNENKSALLVGGTGLVGNELLNLLLDQPAYQTVKVFTRKLMKKDHPKLQQIIVDFDNLAKYKEHMTVDDIYCCLGTTIKKAGTQEAFRKVDYEYPITLAKLAKECAVNRFLIITALGADKSSNVFYNRVKGEVEEELTKLGLPTVQIFRPSLLLGERSEFRLGEKIAILFSPLISIAMVGILRKYKPIQAKDVASAMYLAAQMEVSGECIYLSDQILTISKNAHINGI